MTALDNLAKIVNHVPEVNMFVCGKTDNKWVIYFPQGNITLERLVDKVNMSVIIEGVKYRGERETLEDAFRAADKLLYEKKKDWWLKTRWGILFKEWQGNIKCLMK